MSGMYMYALGLSPNKVTFFVAIILPIFFIIDGYQFMEWESHSIFENAIKN